MAKFPESQALINDFENVEARRGLSIPYNWVGPLTPVIDFALVIGTSAIVGAGYQLVTLGAVGDILMFVSVGTLIQLLVSIILVARGNYKATKLAAFPLQLREVAAAWTIVFLIFLGLLFALKVSDALSRCTTLTFSGAGLCVIVTWRLLVARYLVRSMIAGRFAERRIIVVSGETQSATSHVVSELRRFGYRPLQVATLNEDSFFNGDMSTDLRDTIEEIIAIARDPCARVEELFLVMGPGRDQHIDSILTALRVLPLPVRLIPDQLTSRLLERSITQVGRIWTAELQRAPLTAPERAVKKAFDVAVASTALMLLSPLMLLLAVLIKLDSKGPVLFTQTRNGFNGQTFRIFKFRSMTVQEDAAVIRQAVRNDPRVTRVGRWLRRTSIDELPQLINVLCGDMSIAGPRPHAVAHNDEYGRLIARYAFRHRVKPGLTGWAQVNGFRGETATLDHMIKRVELDIWYINHWSVTLDIKIVLRTLFVPLLCRAAY